jgi:hypothetical protein
VAYKEITMATIKKGDQTVTYSGQLKEGFKKLPNHDDNPSNPQKARRLRLS